MRPNTLRRGDLKGVQDSARQFVLASELSGEKPRNYTMRDIVVGVPTMMSFADRARPCRVGKGRRELRRVALVYVRRRVGLGLEIKSS